MMKLTQILAMLGLPGDGIDDASEDASFRVDDQVDLTLALTADGQFLRLKVLIGHAADPMRLSTNQRIAAANYAGALTGGGALGLNPVNGEILLFKELPVALCEDSGLQAVVSRLIDAAVSWAVGSLPPRTRPRRPKVSRASSWKWFTAQKQRQSGILSTAEISARGWSGCSWSIF